MKKIVSLLFLIFLYANTLLSQVGIGTNTPAASAQLDVTSTERGFLPPRMTAAQRDLIATPASGLLIYQKDNTAGYYYYNGSAWVALANAGQYSAGNGISISNNTISVNPAQLPQSQGTRIGFASSTTWICPANVTQITVEVWGGAGGGAGYLIQSTSSYSQWTAGGKGGNGGYKRQDINVIPGNSYTIIIGSGGIRGLGGNVSQGNSGCGSNGSNGGNSSFGGTIVANSGNGGTGACGSATTNFPITTPATNGASAAIINYPVQYSTRSYLPSYYLNQRPNQVAVGGKGGCNNCPDYGVVVESEDGKPGYCVISY